MLECQTDSKRIIASIRANVPYSTRYVIIILLLPWSCRTVRSWPPPSSPRPRWWSWRASRRRAGEARSPSAHQGQSSDEMNPFTHNNHVVIHTDGQSCSYIKPFCVIYSVGRYKSPLLEVTVPRNPDTYINKRKNVRIQTKHMILRFMKFSAESCIYDMQRDKGQRVPFWALLIWTSYAAGKHDSNK